MLDEIASCMQTSPAFPTNEDMKNDVALVQCVSLLQQYNDDIKQQIVVILDRYRTQTSGIGLEVLLESLRMIETVGIEDYDVDNIVVKLLKHDNETVRITAGRTIGSRQIE
eukprot:TRINITY_DN5528_c0_g1_i2.p1 TRINITY_DN5528_c0_g1~~TRINITY_DN5528_c0_g1_i2.p1  ORF type:complete len:111 (-),score=23.24 TRINITY_DN5528_c0_g1_i2:52-384(-)